MLSIISKRYAHSNCSIAVCFRPRCLFRRCLPFPSSLSPLPHFPVLIAASLPLLFLASLLLRCRYPRLRRCLSCWLLSAFAASTSSTSLKSSIVAATAAPLPRPYRRPGLLQRRTCASTCSHASCWDKRSSVSFRSRYSKTALTSRFSYSHLFHRDCCLCRAACLLFRL